MQVNEAALVRETLYRVTRWDGFQLLMALLRELRREQVYES